MNCKEVEDLIPYYIEENIEKSFLSDFIEHIDSCPDCRDELEVRFLVREGLARLEEGEAFDLEKELDKMLDRSRSIVLIAKRAKLMLVVSGVVLSLALLGVVLGVLVL